MEWISVEDRLPDENGPVLVVVNGCVEERGFIGFMPDKKTPLWGRSRWADDWDYVTHWMPLPEPPKEVSDV